MSRRSKFSSQYVYINHESNAGTRPTASWQPLPMNRGITFVVVGSTFMIIVVMDNPSNSACKYTLL